MLERRIKILSETSEGVADIWNALARDARKSMDVRCAHCRHPKTVKKVVGDFRVFCENCHREYFVAVSEKGVKKTFQTKAMFMMEVARKGIERRFR